MNDSKVLPIHLGLILDGNRRWAKQNGLTAYQGHRKGYDNLKDISIYALNKGVKYLSAYMFSMENWDRTVREVNYLMNLAHRMLTRDLEEMHKENIKILWLGSSNKLSDKLIKAFKKAEELTKDNTRGTLCICFNYGGKQEIVDSVKQIIKSGKEVNKITTSTIEENLYKPEVPQIDMVIRSSGEQRISGFMLWRVSYAELYFTKKSWPEFTKLDLDDALDDYSNRNRRFGK
jgi:undecaprenyl diphosphate synthase